MKMIFGRFSPAPVVRPILVQLGNSEDAPIEAAAKPVILRNSLLVCLPIIAPLDNLFRHRRIYDIDYCKR